MGQEYIIVNHEEEEYLFPETFGDYPKFGGLLHGGGTLKGLLLLLKSRWWSDPISLVGAYCEEYFTILDTYKDVSRLVLKELITDYELTDFFSERGIKVQ